MARCGAPLRRRALPFAAFKKDRIRISAINAQAVTLTRAERDAPHGLPSM
jgi:hypothetical protein